MRKANMQRGRTKDYYCSKHGAVGHTECKECLKKLMELVSDKSAYLTGDVRLKKNG